mmetsp:Transcript_4571/g.10222  ORF Transcript_4571/g.10222 Transcript_4571/m.10222 type:complete len:350 (-) Transcript_4571:273-1322(-)
MMFDTTMTIFILSILFVTTMTCYATSFFFTKGLVLLCLVAMLANAPGCDTLPIDARTALIFSTLLQASVLVMCPIRQAFCRLDNKKVHIGKWLSLFLHQAFLMLRPALVVVLGACTIATLVSLTLVAWGHWEEHDYKSLSLEQMARFLLPIARTIFIGIAQTTATTLLDCAHHSTLLGQVLVGNILALKIVVALNRITINSLVETTILVKKTPVVVRKTTTTMPRRATFLSRNTTLAYEAPVVCDNNNHSDAETIAEKMQRRIEQAAKRALAQKRVQQAAAQCNNKKNNNNRAETMAQKSQRRAEQAAKRALAQKRVQQASANAEEQRRKRALAKARASEMSYNQQRCY